MTATAASAGAQHRSRHHRREAHADRARRRGRDRLPPLHAPAGEDRRPRRSRRAHQPLHRQRQRVARRQRAGDPPASTSCASISLRDQTYRPAGGRKADGPGAAAVGRGPVARRRPDGALRARPGARSPRSAQDLPDDIGGEIVEPAVQGVIYKMFARYTVREIFSTKRAEIQQAIETELQAEARRRRHRAARGADGQGRPAGRLPARHGRPARRGARDREDALHAGAEGQARQGDRARRARPRRCAARRPPRPPRASRSSPRRAQEEAMKHVLPFKQRQIEQRQLEAEADEGVAHQERRGQRAGAPHRGDRRGRRAPEAGRRRGLPPGARRQGQRRADGARRRADHAATRC